MNPLENKLLRILAPLLLAAAAGAGAQVPVDDHGDPLADYEPLTSAPATGNEGIPLLSDAELAELVGPIALYPDDLLAIVLPASTYPLQLVQAQRFLEDLADDPSLQPDEDWDDSVVALLNYPEIVELLNEDLDWTWRLGEAVVAQQTDVVSAVESFRDRAYAAGNLQSDDHQTVAHNDGVIEITPVDDDVIYVPYYEPTEVVVYQPRRVYYYYPRAYPVYYYPYPSSYAFRSGYFWGVTTAFTVGWVTDSLHVFHHSYYGHPYYARHYWDGWWYRRPSIHVHNTIYVNNHVTTSSYRYRSGDYWRPRYEHRRRLSDQRITRSRYYENRNVRDYRERPDGRSNSNQYREREQRVNVRTNSTSQARVKEPRSSDTRPMREYAAPGSERRSVSQAARERQQGETRQAEPRERRHVAPPQRETRQVQPREHRQVAPPQRETRQAQPRERRQVAPPQRETRQVQPREHRQVAPPQREPRQAQPRERTAPSESASRSRERSESRPSSQRGGSSGTNRPRRQRD